MAPSYSDSWETDPEYIDLLNFIIEKTENVKSPMSIQRMAKEFKEKSGAPLLANSLGQRIEKLRTKIQSFEHIDTNTKVKVLFALSASIYAYFLGELKKDALVAVDDKQRIIHYKSNDGYLELKGDHSLSAKVRTAKFEAKRSLRSLVIDYFENKNNISENNENSGMKDLIEFITEKCDNVNAPLSILQLAKDFINHFGISVPLETIHYRINAYRREIPTLKFLDTHSKVKQLFCLSEKLNSDFLKELQKNAFVEVDEKNRITKYTANDGSLTLRGSHYGSKMTNPGRIQKKRVKSVVTYDSEEESDNERSNGSSEEYSSEEFDSEFDSEEDNEHDPSPKSFKRKTETTGSCSSKRIRNDYDSYYSIEDRVKLEPFRGSIQEDLKGVEEDGDIQQIPIPLQALYEHNEPLEVPIKEEHEESVEVKPETSHNPKIKFFDAMQSLILCLDTPSLSWIQSKIQQKINKLEGSHEVILNNEIIQVIELLIARMRNHSVENHSKNGKSMNLSNFLCYLKASLLNSKMSGVEDLVENISELIEESQDKRILMEDVANVLRATLVKESF